MAAGPYKRHGRDTVNPWLMDRGIPGSTTVEIATLEHIGRIVAGPTLAASELPLTTHAARAAPSTPTAPDEEPTLGLD